MLEEEDWTAWCSFEAAGCCSQPEEPTGRRRCPTEPLSHYLSHSPSLTLPLSLYLCLCLSLSAFLSAVKHKENKQCFLKEPGITFLDVCVPFLAHKITALLTIAKPIHLFHVSHTAPSPIHSTVLFCGVWRHNQTGSPRLSLFPSFTFLWH